MSVIATTRIKDFFRPKKTILPPPRLLQIPDFAAPPAPAAVAAPVATENPAPQPERTDDNTSREEARRIRAYFCDLLARERALCGSRDESASAWSRERLRREVMRARDWMIEGADGMLVTLDVWRDLWRKCQGMDISLALAAACIDERSEGGPGLTVLREQWNECRAALDRVGGSLRGLESRLETRFAGALELLWRAEPDNLPADLAARRESLPDLAALYGCLAERMEVFREISCTHRSLSGIAIKAATTKSVTALHSTALVLRQRLEMAFTQFFAGLDNAPPPAEFVQGTPSLAAHFQNHAAGDSGPALHGAGMGEVSLSLRRGARIVERFPKLYQSVLARLVAAADAAESMFA